MFSWVDYTIPEEELIPRREKISCPKCHYEPTYPEIEHMYNIVKMLKRKK
jgi:hypothetical protein